jgi:phosphatidate cytidylyltransferase
LAGGLILPGLALAGYVSVFGGSAWRGFAIGAVLAAAGHAGDLFESWVKRLTGHKDSGESIPGHGGVLDRLDSMLVVTPIAALLVMVFGVARLFGVHA